MKKDVKPVVGKKATLSRLSRNKGDVGPKSKITLSPKKSSAGGMNYNSGSRRGS